MGQFEGFIDVPKFCTRKLVENNSLAELSLKDIHFELKGQRLFIKANDSSRAVAAACQVLLTMKNLGTNVQHTYHERACAWPEMLTSICEKYGKPIATSSSLNEFDVIHAFSVFSTAKRTNDLTTHEYALFSWAWIANSR